VTKIAGVLVAFAVLCSAALASGGTANGHIVFAATDAPNNDDVMLVHADGSELDLSSSPAYDATPLVSPTGKQVAFSSTRGGHSAEWVVGVDGTGLRQVTPSLGTAQPQVAWAPNGRDLAVVVNNTLHLASATGGVWVRIDRRDKPQGVVGWSPDGTRVAYVSGLLDNVVVVTRAGKMLHSYVGIEALWSTTGRLAVRRDNETWAVYGATGRQLARFAADSVAWSPHGRLASVTVQGLVQVRAGGAGAPILSVRPIRHATDPVWADETHLLLRGENGFVSYDLAHKATFELAAAYRINPSLASDGSAYGESPWNTLAHSTLSGSTRVVATVPYCQGKDADAFSGLQALPDGSGAVFAGDCQAPNDLFSVAPDGTSLTRLTQTTTDELDPSLSPDGTRVAFARVDSADCDGCTHQIWTTNLDGSDPQSVALPSTKGNPILQDDNPSFSPDGTHVVFERWDAPITGDSAAIYTASASGGAATPLQLTGGYPAWGPAAIAFDAGGGGVRTVQPDGSGPQVVAKGDWIPAWSGDGRLALIKWGGGFSILLPATGRRIALPGLSDAGFVPPGLAWSPDGTKLAFTAADADGGADVWTIGVDGTGLTRVTRGLDASGALSWR
jgi:Tol biopolymer transport system component